MPPLGYTYCETVLHHTDIELSVNQWNQNRLLSSEYILILLTLPKERKHAYKNHHAVLVCLVLCVLKGRGWGHLNFEPDDIVNELQCEGHWWMQDLVRWYCKQNFEKYNSVTYSVCRMYHNNTAAEKMSFTNSLMATATKFLELYTGCPTS